MLSSESLKNTDWLSGFERQDQTNVITDEDVPPWFIQYSSPYFVTITSRHTWNLKCSGNLDAKPL